MASKAGNKHNSLAYALVSTHIKAIGTAATKTGSGVILTFPRPGFGTAIYQFRTLDNSEPNDRPDQDA